MNHVDSERDRGIAAVELTLVAVDGKRPRVRPIKTRRDCHQRCLTSSVLPDQATYLSGSHPEGHVVVSRDRSEALRDVAQLERELGSGDYLVTELRNRSTHKVRRQPTLPVRSEVRAERLDLELAVHRLLGH